MIVFGLRIKFLHHCVRVVVVVVICYQISAVFIFVFNENKKQCDLSRKKDWERGSGDLGKMKLSLPEVEWLAPDHINFPFSQDIQPLLLQPLPCHFSLRWRNAHWVVGPVRQSKRPYWSQHLPGASGQCPTVPQRTPCPGTSHRMRRNSTQAGFSAGPWRSRPWVAGIHWVAQTGLVLAILLLQLPHHVQLVVLHSLHLVLASPLVLGMNGELDDSGNPFSKRLPNKFLTLGKIKKGPKESFFQRGKTSAWIQPCTQRSLRTARTPSSHLREPLGPEAWDSITIVLILIAVALTGRKVT